MELVMIIIMMGILAAVAYPKIQDSTRSGYRGQATGLLQTLNGSLHLLYNDRVAFQNTTPYTIRDVVDNATWAGMTITPVYEGSYIVTIALDGQDYTFEMTPPELFTAPGAIAAKSWPE